MSTQPKTLGDALAEVARITAEPTTPADRCAAALIALREAYEERAAREVEAV